MRLFSALARRARRTASGLRAAIAWWAAAFASYGPHEIARQVEAQADVTRAVALTVQLHNPLGLEHQNSATGLRLLPSRFPLWLSQRSSVVGFDLVQDVAVLVPGTLSVPAVCRAVAVAAASRTGADSATARKI